MSFISVDTKQVPLFLIAAAAGGGAAYYYAKKQKADSLTSYIIAGVLLPIAVIGAVQEYRKRKLNTGNGFTVISIPPVLPPVSGSVGT